MNGMKLEAVQTVTGHATAENPTICSIISVNSVYRLRYA